MARLRGEEAGQVGQRDESFLGPWQERRPASRVIFRPEEIHARSEERRAAARRTEAEVEVTDDASRLDAGDAPIAHLEGHRIAAVEAWRVHADDLAGEQPGDRRRLEATLREPDLATTDRDSVLRRQVVQRRERGEGGGRGVKPLPGAPRSSSGVNIVPMKSITPSGYW